MAVPLARDEASKKEAESTSRGTSMRQASERLMEKMDKPVSSRLSSYESVQKLPTR